MRRLIAFIILASVKTISTLFYRGKFHWLSDQPENPWKKARLIVFMNHTSLFEPLFIQHLSFSTLWYLAGHMNVPGADVTLDRPIVGAFWKLMIPGIASITRRRDNSWHTYMASIREDSVIIIAPEGRMKRPGGLDKFGKPMTIRGGVADILEDLNEGGIILCLSGGLHHVQRPGEHLPRIFKPIEMNFTYLDIRAYKNQFSQNPRERKMQIVRDLQERLVRDCPKDSSNK
jgi:1-acyl-sn-glycerol-3-phosphate acyltransferase